MLWISEAGAALPSVALGGADINRYTMEELPKPVGDFILKHAVGVEGNDGMYYHYSDVCRLLCQYHEAEVKKLNKHGVSGSVCECTEPIPQMTNKGMYCLRCETPIKQTDR